MHSIPKIIALIFIVLFFIGGMFLVNLSAKHCWTECLLDIFNNITCAFLGALIAFIYKNDLLSIKKSHPFNED